ncbi:MAG: ATP-binding protein [Pseudobdellovibrionaceae bacterium]|nr:ATP-binding protein [Pseudobdellovibrionaceae bacterium]
MPAERLTAGKPQSGLLSIAAQAGDTAVRVTIRDDGRGLALGKLRERGLQSGMLNSSSSDLEVAQTIFAPGTSTATAVSDISGRGIGMSAVRSFIEKVGGASQYNSERRRTPQAISAISRSKSRCPWVIALTKNALGKDYSLPPCCFTMRP